MICHCVSNILNEKAPSALQPDVVEDILSFIPKNYILME